MSIVYSTGSTTNGISSSFTFSHNMTAQPNSVLMVTLAIRTVTSTGTSVTYAGQNLNLYNGVDFTTNCRNEIWYLTNPTGTGVNDIVVNLVSSSKTAILADSYYGVDTSDLFGASGTQATSSTAASIPLTTTKANSWIYNSVNGRANGGITWTAVAPNTARGDDSTNTASSASNAHGISNDMTTTSIGSYITSGTWSTSIAFIYQSVEMKEFVQVAFPYSHGYVIKPFK